MHPVDGDELLREGVRHAVVCLPGAHNAPENLAVIQGGEKLLLELKEYTEGK